MRANVFRFLILPNLKLFLKTGDTRAVEVKYSTDYNLTLLVLLTQEVIL